MKIILKEVKLKLNLEDNFVWSLWPGGKFSVKSCYKGLRKLEEEEDEVDPESKEAAIRIWKSKVPSKIKIFGWRMLLD